MSSTASTTSGSLPATASVRGRCAGLWIHLAARATTDPGDPAGCGPRRGARPRWESGGGVRPLGNSPPKGGRQQAHVFAGFKPCWTPVPSGSLSQLMPRPATPRLAAPRPRSAKTSRLPPGRHTAVSIMLPHAADSNLQFPERPPGPGGLAPCCDGPSAKGAIRAETEPDAPVGPADHVAARAEVFTSRPVVAGSRSAGLEAGVTHPEPKAPRRCRTGTGAPPPGPYAGLTPRFSDTDQCDLAPRPTAYHRVSAANTLLIARFGSLFLPRHRGPSIPVSPV